MTTWDHKASIGWSRFAPGMGFHGVLRAYIACTGNCRHGGFQAVVGIWSSDSDVFNFNFIPIHCQAALCSDSVVLAQGADAVRALSGVFLGLW